MTILADIVEAESGWAEVFFIVAIALAVLSAVGAFGANALTKHAGWMLAAAVAAVALGWLLL